MKKITLPALIIIILIAIIYRDNLRENILLSLILSTFFTISVSQTILYGIIKFKSSNIILIYLLAILIFFVTTLNSNIVIFAIIMTISVAIALVLHNNIVVLFSVISVFIFRAFLITLIGTYEEIFMNIEECGVIAFLSLVLNMLIMYCFYLFNINKDDVKEEFFSYMSSYARYFIMIYIPFLVIVFLFSALTVTRDMIFFENNIIPFKTILFYLRGLSNSYVSILNILGNLFLFMPLGFFVPQLFKKINKWYYICIIGFCFSLCIEVSQLLLLRGIFDIDDVILNLFGCILGYILKEIYFLIPKKILSAQASTSS